MEYTVVDDFRVPLWVAEETDMCLCRNVVHAPTEAYKIAVGSAIALNAPAPVGVICTQDDANAWSRCMSGDVSVVNYDTFDPSSAENWTSIFLDHKAFLTQQGLDLIERLPKQCHFWMFIDRYPSNGPECASLAKYCKTGIVNFSDSMYNKNYVPLVYKPDPVEGFSVACAIYGGRTLSGTDAVFAIADALMRYDYTVTKYLIQLDNDLQFKEFFKDINFASTRFDDLLVRIELLCGNYDWNHEKSLAGAPKRIRVFTDYIDRLPLDKRAVVVVNTDDMCRYIRMKAPTLPASISTCQELADYPDPVLPYNVFVFPLPHSCVDEPKLIARLPHDALKVRVLGMGSYEKLFCRSHIFTDDVTIEEIYDRWFSGLTTFA